MSLNLEEVVKEAEQLVQQLTARNQLLDTLIEKSTFSKHKIQTIIEVIKIF